MKISQELSNKIANMSFVCACLVVSIHVKWGGDVGSVCWWMREIFKSGYSNIAVPFFFVVSGYFLAGHINESGWWKRETIKRVKSLLIPFFVFALLVALLGAPVSIIADYRAGRPFGTTVTILNVHKWLPLVGLKLDVFPLYAPLWFLRSLFIYVLLSPGIVWLLRKIGWGWIVLLFMGSFALYYAPDLYKGGWSGFLQHGLSIRGLMYFSLGLYLRMRDVHIYSKWLTLWVFCVVTGGGIGIKLWCAHHEIVSPVPLLLIVIPGLMYATWFCMPSCRLVPILVGMSFPIYLLHSIMLGYWRMFTSLLCLNVSLATLLSWPIAIIASIIVAQAIRKLWPTVYSTMFGGR